MQFLIQRGPLMVAVLLLLAMLGTLGWEGYRFWQDLGRQAQPTQTQTRQTVQRNDEPRNVDLAKLHLFGDPARKEAPKQIETAELPETNLRLVLRGVMAGDDEAPASALIEGPNKDTESYRLEASLPGGATLHAIHPNRIVIERRGRLENLYFPKDAEDSGIERYSAPEVASNDSEPEFAPQQTSSTAQTTPTNADISEERKAEIRARLDKLRERLRANY